MVLTPALHVGLLAVAVLTTAALAGYAWRHRTEHAVTPFGGLMVGFTLYSGAHLVGLLVFHPWWRLFWESLQWTGTALIPVFWLLFALAYTGHDGLVTRRTVAALSAVPAATIVLSWTNGWHGLMWRENTIVVVRGLAVLEQPFGPWAVLFTLVAYGMLLVGTFLVLRLVWQSNRLYAGQALLLAVGVTLPLLANVLTVFGLTPIRDPALDLSPYAFSVTGLAFGYALFRHRLFALVPATYRLGRDDAIRGLEEGVVILDTDRRVVYCNRAAADLVDRDPSDVLGEPVRSLVDDSKLDFDAEDALAELEREDGVYEVRTSPIRDRRDRLIGHTLIVQDVTGRDRRERWLRRQRDELAQLAELNTLIRGVNRALVSATSREEVEEAVCRELTDSDRYRTACMADVQTWNGDADRWTVAGPDDSTSPPGTLADPAPAPAPAPDPDSEVAPAERPEVSVADRPDRAGTWTVVPVVYGRTVYGALGLYAAPEDDEAPSVTDRERAVLTELGELIGHAIDAVESRRLLAAQSVVELDLRSEDADGPLVAASERADCRLEVTGLVPDAGDGHLAYVRAGDDATTVADTLADRSGGPARAVRGGEEGDGDGDDADGSPGLVEWTVPSGTLLGTLVDQGAHVLDASVAEGIARFEAELAADADVRALVERLQRAFPETWVEAKRERDRPTERADTISGSAVEDLTDRQQEALEVAYRAGYFAWPRESTAEEVAETLDIAAPTLHAHLRKAEDSLLAELFERDRRSSD